MDYKKRTAEEIFCQYWREYLQARTLHWGLCIAFVAAIFLMPRFSGYLWVLLGLFLLYLLLINLLRQQNVRRSASVNLVLSRDCDAVKYAEIFRLLAEKRQRKSSLRAVRLNRASGLYWSGRFREALDELEKVGGKMNARSLSVWDIRQRLAFHCRIALDDVAGAEALYQETAARVEKLTKPSLRECGEAVLRTMEEGLDWKKGNVQGAWERARQLAGEADSNLEQVSAAYALAREDLRRNDKKSARKHLEFVIQQGGTLFLVEKARALLAEWE